MEKLRLRHKAVKKALKTLKESLDLIEDPECNPLYNELRDSVIKRFEYSIDIFWKYIREYLEDVNKITIGPVISAKAVFRASLNAKLISQAEFDLLLISIDDRNLTSHTYNEELAEAISSRIKKYFVIVNQITERIS